MSDCAERFPPTVRAMHRPGFTLVEILAVVTIMGLLAAVGVPVVVGWAGAAREREWYPRLQDAERSVRIAAIGQGRVVELLADGLAERDQRSGAPHDLVRIPESWRLIWEAPDGAALGRLAYDHHGRSSDVRLRARVGDREFHATLSGLTGEWSALQAVHAGAP